MFGEGDRDKNINLQAGDLIIVGAMTQDEENAVVLFGQVVRPGRYPFKKGMTVIDAIALGGGLTPIASGNGTKVIRTKEGQRTTMNIPLDSILKGGSKGKNIELEPNDVIVVPESFF
jgi:polysaccharide export outer membrane protein